MRESLVCEMHSEPDSCSISRDFENMQHKDNLQKVDPPPLWSIQ